MCQKFLFSEETLALGLHFYQTLRHLHSHERFWACSCLIVAGKAGELDKNVPYLNRYQRYADKNFSQEDYEHAERVIFEALSFDLQFSTFVTFLDFFLARGVLSEKDKLSESLVELFEADVTSIARDFLRKGTFTRFEAELLALSIIKQARSKYGLTAWPRELVELTGKEDEEVQIFTSSEPAVMSLKELFLNENTSGKAEKTEKEKTEPEKAEKGKVEKGVSRKKYDYRPHFGSGNKLKENSFSSSKLTLQSRKSSQPFVENFSTLNTDVLRRR